MTPTVTIEQLFREEYGTELKGSGPIRSGKCPWHTDNTPSLSVNIEDGWYKCHSCDRKGNIYSFLTEFRGMGKREAYALANGEEPPKPKEKRKPFLWRSIPEKDRNIFPRKALHSYRDSGGQLLFHIARWVKGPDQPKVTPWHAVPGGWLQQMPDGMSKADSRPLYRLPELLASEGGSQVMVVEGEKCADAVAEFFPGFTVTTWSGGATKTGGTGKLKLTDWTPLYGREVLLVADADSPGRETMRQLVAMLWGHATSIRVVLPPDDKQYNDIADWIAIGGPDEAAERIRKMVAAADQPNPEEESRADGEDDVVIISEGIAKNDYFEILGNVLGEVVVMLSTSIFLFVSRTALTQPATLISLAPDLGWWMEKTGAPMTRLTPGICQSVGAALIRAADSKGQLNMTNMLGRGAFMVGNEIVWNLGDRLFRNGEEQPLGNLVGNVRALAGSRIHLPKTVATVEDRSRIASAVLKYRWARPVDGKRFMGWLVTAICGGALDWRPHLWLSAQAQLGKTWLLQRVAEPILGDMVVKSANATAASLARSARSDSIAVILDEAEPDRSWIEDIMDLTRIAAGGDGARIRASAAEGVQTFNPRFSAMLCSIKVANMTEADATRFTVISLSHEPADDWPAVRDGIESALLAPEMFKASIIADAGEIIANARKITDKLINDGVQTRRSMIDGALSAGWQWWSGLDESLYEEEVDDGNDSEADAIELLRSIIGIRLRTDKGEDKSVLSLLAGDHRNSLCADYGIRMDPDDDLLIATQHPSLKTKLRSGRFSNVNLAKTLRQIDGIVAHQARFGAVKLRCCKVPLAVLQKLEIDIAGDLEGDTEPQQRSLEDAPF